MCAKRQALNTYMCQFWDFVKCCCYGNKMVAMKHGFLITAVNMLQTAQNFTCLITMQPSRHLSLLWGVLKCRCHDDRSLAIKHGVYVTVVTPMYIVRSAWNFPRLLTAESGKHLCNVGVRTTANLRGSSKTCSLLLIAARSFHFYCNASIDLFSTINNYPSCPHFKQSCIIGNWILAMLWLQSLMRNFLGESTVDRKK